jgi:hypothetical protein
MSFRPVSEKAAEILFTRFMLQAFPLGQLELFAPSSAEEFISGYDAKLVGRASFRELYLQFKAPTYSERYDRFTIRPTAHQHRLLKAYPANSAFYVAGMFRSLHDFNTQQTHLHTVADFMARFVCIEVSALPDRIDFFHFFYLSPNSQLLHVACKVPEDGLTRIARHAVSERGWLRGHTLLTNFKADALGVVVGLDDSDLSPASDDVARAQGMLFNESVWYPSRSQLYELSGDCTPSDFGIHLRKENTYDATPTHLV